MFFLKDNYTIGYKWGTPTFYGTKHLGEDYLVPTGTKIFAPKPGTVIKTVFGTDGGNTMFFRPDNENVTYRLLHLSEYVVKTGHVEEGTLIAKSGNTGAQTTAPHVHFDAFKGSTLPPLVYTNFINPHDIDWSTKVNITLKIKVLANNNNWASLQIKLDQIADWYKSNSTNVKGSVSLQFDVEQTNFTDIPFEDYDGNPSFFAWGAAKQWQIDNLLWKARNYDILVFHMRPEDWDVGNHPHNNGVMLGDFEPYKVAVINQRALENTPTLVFGSDFVYITCHEISHAMLGFTSQDWLNGENTTHKRFYTPDFVDAPKIFEDLNYQTLNAVLNERRKGEPMLIIYKKSAPTTKFALSSDMKIGFADFPAYQKFVAGRQVVEVQLEDVEFNRIPTSPVVIKT